MNELKIINIDGVECYEKDGTAYLKLETVARGLGFTTVATSGNEVVRWNTVHKYLTDLGVATSCNGTNYREMCPEFIPENIFYRLAMKAKNEAAEKFQAKVADEIIPSIRRTGGYQVHTPQGKELLALAVLEAQRTIEAQAAEIDRMKPKEVFADAVSTSHTAILIGDLAKILKQNGIETGQKRLFAWLRENGFLIKRKGTDWNMPTQKSMEMGLFEVKESTVNNPDGSVRINRTTKVTGKGQVYFVNKFLEVMA
ncbi:hypothetical protein B5E84_16145 [Lachnoclostridium sp. An14]|uniref:phage antirepressor n=1 Tax=Lachnoclostridium sp. An14 TaxID=1965562 RepID=UPI000B3728B5|nr:phage antirepressor KilAC domain-containing protein [Lachnoclostridium sp. An14]OUQ14477.1 hypothetical protein B5E84_16145 [Lachnoclostridium sp. An14]